jgi:hypothetical protein
MLVLFEEIAYEYLHCDYLLFERSHPLSLADQCLWRGAGIF